MEQDFSIQNPPASHPLEAFLDPLQLPLQVLVEDSLAVHQPALLQLGLCLGLVREAQEEIHLWGAQAAAIAYLEMLVNQQLEVGSILGHQQVAVLLPAGSSALLNQTRKLGRPPAVRPQDLYSRRRASLRTQELLPKQPPIRSVQLLAVAAFLVIKRPLVKLTTPLPQVNKQAHFSATLLRQQDHRLAQVRELEVPPYSAIAKQTASRTPRQATSSVDQIKQAEIPRPLNRRAPRSLHLQEILLRTQTSPRVLKPLHKHRTYLVHHL